MIRYAKSRGHLEKYPFETYSLKPIQKEVTYLTMDEVNTLIATDFGESLNRVRDCFVFSIYTGLAYTELRNLHGNHIVTGYDGAKWIKMVRKKTQKEFLVPILPIAWNIMLKYNPNGMEGKLLLPTISNAKTNQNLKIIASKCGIKTHVTVHLARRTFAVTILLMNDVPIHVISEVLGHSNINVTAKAYSKTLPTMTKTHFARISGLIN
jgi:integrase